MVIKMDFPSLAGSYSLVQSQLHSVLMISDCIPDQFPWTVVGGINNDIFQLNSVQLVCASNDGCNFSGAD